MTTLISVVHLLAAFILIFLVLIQDSKGAMGGMMGGGGSNTLFGATGATSFIVKLTRAMAIVFAATCIILTVLSSHRSGSVVDSYVPEAQTPAAQTPAETPATPAAPATPGDSNGTN